MQELQPKLKEIQKKYKENKEEQTKAMMALYKEHKTNPLGGCLPLIVQLIVLIAIYQVIVSITEAGLTINQADLYSFVRNPGEVNHLFLHFLDLTKLCFGLPLSDCPVRPSKNAFPEPKEGCSGQGPDR